MRVLVACEFSGRVREAFRVKGYDAYSCDLLPADDRSPHHFRQDVEPLLLETWDLVIAHPPCTYLCNSGVRWLRERGPVQRLCHRRHVLPSVPQREQSSGVRRESDNARIRPAPSWSRSDSSDSAVAVRGTGKEGDVPVAQGLVPAETGRSERA
jgi:hypothetical protein